MAFVGGIQWRGEEARHANARWCVRRLAAGVPERACRGAAAVWGTRMSAMGAQAEAGSAAATAAVRKRFVALKADAFRHPVDVQATRILRSLFVLEFALRRMLAVVEYAFYLDNLSSSVLVSDRQLPEVHTLLKDACEILCIEEVPQLYIRSNPVPNAYTMAFQGKQPSIVVHSSLVDMLSPAELQAVIAHELGHLKCEHGVWVTMANLVMLFTQTFGGTLAARLTDAMNLALMQWLRAAELTCDRAALLVAQDPNVVVSVLMKLSGGAVNNLSSQLNVKEYIRQVEMFETASKNPLGRLFRRGMTEGLSHPLPVLRVKELVQYSKSSEYKALIGSTATTR